MQGSHLHGGTSNQLPVGRKRKLPDQPQANKRGEMQLPVEKSKKRLQPPCSERQLEEPAKANPSLSRPHKETDRPQSTEGTLPTDTKQKQTKKPKSCQKGAPTKLSPHKIRIFTLNVWGLQTKGKLEELKSFLYEYTVHVCIVTETHLLKAEAKKKIIPGYVVADAAGIYTNKGGVMLLVSNLISWREVPAGHTSEMGDVCVGTCLLYPTKDESNAIRLSGVYVPPSVNC